MKKQVKNGEATPSKNSASDFLGVDVNEKEDKKEIKEEKVEKKEVQESENIEISDENSLFISEDLSEIIETVKKDIEEKKINPSYLEEGEMGVNHIDGKPHMIIGDKYVPYEEAQKIIQTRKVVREWLKLQEINKK